jgi:hypothetical protein
MYQVNFPHVLLLRLTPILIANSILEVEICSKSLRKTTQYLIFIKENSYLLAMCGNGVRIKYFESDGIC